MNDIT